MEKRERERVKTRNSSSESSKLSEVLINIDLQMNGLQNATLQNIRVTVL